MEEETMCWRCGGSGEVEGRSGTWTCPECNGTGVFRDMDEMRDIHVDYLEGDR